MRSYLVTDPITLRRTCIDKEWFTCGTARQYEKMFLLNNDFESEHWTIEDVALVIWICSDNKIYELILRKLKQLHYEYEMRINSREEVTE